MLIEIVGKLQGVTAKDNAVFIIEELEQLAELDTSLNIPAKL